MRLFCTHLLLTATLTLASVPLASRLAAADENESEASLNLEQEAILREFRRFEDNLLKSAESTRRTDPNRAELLLRARGLSVEERIAAEMERISAMLNGESARYGAAADRQDELIASMEAVLKLLQTENERDRLEEERARIEELLKETNKMIAKQRDVRADTGRGGSEERLKSEQEQLAEDAGDLADKIAQQDEQRARENGESSDDPQDGDPNGENPEGEPPAEGEPSENEPSDGDPEARDPQEGDPSEGDPSESEPSESGETPEGQEPSESDPESQPGGETPPGETPPSETQPGQSPPPGQQGSPPQEGQPQDGQQPPPSEQTPGREELENAQKQMQQAIEELEKKQRENAGEAQDEAVAELERLKAKLEEILRQLREEEEEILLALLEARFQQMLQLQMRVNAATTRLDKTPDEDRVGSFNSSATQLSRDQGEILLEAVKALRLLQEEGSSAAFPEAVSQMCDSMRQVEKRLQGTDVGKTTQLIETMIVEALEEMIVALQKELEEKQDEDSQNQQQQQQQGGEQQQALVDQIAELKMIRSLQSAVNRMTEQFDNALAEKPDAVPSAEDEEFLLDLARRQQRIQEITYELATKRTD